MKIAFLINGLICNKKQIKAELSAAFQSYTTEFFVTEYAKHMIDLCHKVLAQGFDAIAVVGGDGTVNEAVNGVVTFYKTNDGYDWESVAKVKLIVIPRGSGNDFSRMLYQNNSLSHIAELVKQNSFSLKDIGEAHLIDFNGNQITRFFDNITDIGIGGDVVQRRIKLRKWLPASLVYHFSILTTFLTYRKKNVEYLTKKEQFKGKVMSLIIANGKYFGNGLGIAPQAKINDGELVLVRLGNVSVLDYIKKLSIIKRCEKVAHPEIDYSSCKTITIKSVENTVIPIDMDGEYVGVAPLTISCLPKKLFLLSEKE